MGGLSNAPIPDHHVPANPPNRGVEKSPFEIAAKLSTSCGVVERPDHHCGDDLLRLIQIAKNTTPMYRAPEMLDLYQNYPINEQSDIWVSICQNLIRLIRSLSIAN